MDSLFLLLPLSVLLVLALIGLFAWALHGGQFDDLEREGWRVLETAEPAAEPDLGREPDADAATPDPSQAKISSSRENRSDTR